MDRAVAALCAVLLAPALGFADPRDEHARREERRGQHFEQVHGQSHYYLNRGVVVSAIPHGAAFVGFHGDRYWFHEGVWYRPSGPGFVVVAPPFGIVLPLLPAFAAVVAIGGVQYYYGNDTYYVYRPDLGGYEVVAPPPGAAPPVDAPPGTPPPPATPAPGMAPPGATAPPAPPMSDNVFVYPKNGQTAEQTARDRYECYRWASAQTGFDPSRPAGGYEVSSRRSDYLRAQQACLEGRGYTVR